MNKRAGSDWIRILTLVFVITAELSVVTFSLAEGSEGVILLDDLLYWSTGLRAYPSCQLNLALKATYAILRPSFSQRVSEGTLCAD